MWGLLTSIDLKSCDKSLISNSEVIYKFTKELVDLIEMKAFGEPQIEYFGDGNKAGYTLVQLIETSCLTAHFCDETGDAYIDIFSCKEYPPNIAADMTKSYFRAESMQFTTLNRG